MKKLSYFLFLFVIIHIIIFPIASDYYLCFTSTCAAAEKITPYRPQVRYSESYASTNTEPAGDVETTKKRKLWLWIVGGLVVVGAAALGAGGGGGDGGGDEAGTSSGSDNVDVDVSW